MGGFVRVHGHPSILEDIKSRTICTIKTVILFLFAEEELFEVTKSTRVELLSSLPHLQACTYRQCYVLILQNK